MAFCLQTSRPNDLRKENLTSNPIIPEDPAGQELKTQSKTRLTTAILTRISSDIHGQILVKDDEPSPFHLINPIIAHINQATKHCHQVLKKKAKSIQFKNDTKLSGYVKEHKKVRQ